MAVAYRASNDREGTGTLTRPTGTTAGDILILSIHWSVTTAGSVTGYTQFRDQNNSTLGSTTIYYRTATGDSSDDASIPASSYRSILSAFSGAAIPTLANSAATSTTGNITTTEVGKTLIVGTALHGASQPDFGAETNYTVAREVNVSNRAHIQYYYTNEAAAGTYGETLAGANIGAQAALIINLPIGTINKDVSVSGTITLGTNTVVVSPDHGKLVALTVATSGDSVAHNPEHRNTAALTVGTAGDSVAHSGAHAPSVSGTVGTAGDAVVISPEHGKAVALTVGTAGDSVLASADRGKAVDATISSQTGSGTYSPDHGQAVSSPTLVVTGSLGVTVSATVSATGAVSHTGAHFPSVSGTVGTAGDAIVYTPEHGKAVSDTPTATGAVSHSSARDGAVALTVSSTGAVVYSPEHGKLVALTVGVTESGVYSPDHGKAVDLTVSATGTEAHPSERSGFATTTVGTTAAVVHSPDHGKPVDLTVTATGTESHPSERSGFAALTVGTTQSVVYSPDHGKLVTRTDGTVGDAVVVSTERRHSVALTVTTTSSVLGSGDHGASVALTVSVTSSVVPQKDVLASVAGNTGVVLGSGVVGGTDVSNAAYRLIGSRLDFGRGTKIHVARTTISGYPIMTDDTNRAAEDGLKFGTDRHGSPRIEFDMNIKTTTVDEALGLWQNLQTLWGDHPIRKVRDGVTPLYMRYYSRGEPRIVYGRPRDVAVVLGSVHQGWIPVTTAFDCVDRYFYEEDLSVAELGLLTTNSFGGFITPFISPFITTSLGSVSTSVMVTGDVDPWFQWRVYGPVHNPKLTVGSMTFQLNHFIPATEWVEVDTRPWSRGVRNSQGVALRGRLTQQLRKLRLPVGAQSTVYSGYDVTRSSHSTLTWRAAYETL